MKTFKTSWREKRLQWYGHVVRKDDSEVKLAMELNVQGAKKKGRTLKRWIDG